MSDYGRLQDERDALLIDNEKLRARVAELEAWVPASGDNQMIVATDEATPPEPEPEGFAAMSATADQIATEKVEDKPGESVDWDAVHKAETDKVIAEGQPNG